MSNKQNDELVDLEKDYLAEKPTMFVSFSGGRTSGYMCKWLLDNKSDEYFGGVQAFEKHRVGVRGRVEGERACLAPSKVSNKRGEQVLHLNNRGYWVQKFSQS